MYHTRFLKVPFTGASIKTNGKNAKRQLSGSPTIDDSVIISSKIVLTTELGENFFYGAIPVCAEILFISPEVSRKRKRVELVRVGQRTVVGKVISEWRNGMRALQLDVQIPRVKAEEILRNKAHLCERVYAVSAEAVDECPLLYDSKGDPLRLAHMEIESLPFRLIYDVSLGLKRKAAIAVEFDEDNSLYVRREVDMGAYGQLDLVEEIGDSMAKHLW